MGGNIELLKQEMDKQGITDKRLRLAILGVVGKESGFIPQSEKPYNTTALSRIRKIFGSKLKGKSDSEVEQLKRDPPAFFSLIYGGRYGNRPGTDDGWKYRGRGFNQITFRGTYEKYGLKGNPDSLNDPAVAARVAIEFLGKRLDQIKGKDHKYDNLNDAVRDVAQANAGLGKKGSALTRAIANTKKSIKKHFGEEPEVSEIS